MNDRFKFRVWLKDEKRYGYLLNLFNCGAASSQYEVEEYDEQGDHYTVYSANEVILQQCMGLKDKNGKLIFEGDIVEVQYLGAQISIFKNEYSKQPENERFEVFCHEDWLKFYAKNDHYRKTCEIHSLDLEKIIANTYNKVYEVIGNIYENPELLEE